MMSLRLVTLGAWLLTATMAPGQTPGGSILAVGYLVTSPSDAPAPHGFAYRPQPGDIVISDDFNRFYHLALKFADTAPPTHASIVFASADGKPMLLDLTGPHLLTSKVMLLDVDARFQSYPGVIQVRRLRQPLTPEQSRELTEFALAQQGKRFAIGRIALMGTPFSARNGLRNTLFGHTYLNRNRWFCSELVIAACAKASLIDPRACCGNAIYPRDLAVDQHLDLSLLYHPPLTWTPR